jgi:acetolactate synthase-1/2/3 large subunit
VRGLDEVPGIRPVLGLFEGVFTGAADGYARVCGSPALTLLHLGPGLANGLANLHNSLT